MDGQVVIVAVDASKEMTDYALEWAVKNVTQATDTLVVLAVLPSAERPPAAANRTNNFLSYLLNICGQQKVRNSSHRKGLRKVVPQDKSRKINKVLTQMIRQLCLFHNKQVHSEVKVVADAQLGSVATEAEELEATWVVVEQRLRKEADCCVNKLDCNIVIVDHAIPKVLRAVNPRARKKIPVTVERMDPTMADALGVLPASTSNYESATTRSTLGLESPVFETYRSESLSSARKEQFQSNSNVTNKSKSPNSIFCLNSAYFQEEIDAEAAFSPSPSYSKSQPTKSVVPILKFDVLPSKLSASPLDEKVRIYGNLSLEKIDMERINSPKDSQLAVVRARRSTDSPGLLQKPENRKRPSHPVNRNHSWSVHEEEKLPAPSSLGLQRTASIRIAMSLSMKQPPMPPPLCTVCKHSTPIFGKTPRKFSYKEIDVATDGFSTEHLLTEGGYGSVYKGILPDGQVVAVKQHKTLSAQGASEFCLEVEVLSCAQHRNLVMLVGYCIEKEWLLVYEFACNGSLDEHLYGMEKNDEVMTWYGRMKVAIGAARGLRYLHEDCRVGCIVHRDFRPNNILLTHDFEPMVGDFGLARWQADGQLAEETRVIGAFGYLAPEYTQTGLITEKVDVYSFGVVLLELLSGIKATDFARNIGHQFVMEWGRPLLQEKMAQDILDPRLEGNYVEKQVECMMYAASLCTSLSPEKRPRMSKVLKILEGDVPSDLASSLGQYISSYPKQYMNNVYDSDSSIVPALENKPSTTRHTLDQPPSLMMQRMHLMEESPPRTHARRINDANGIYMSLTDANDLKAVKSVWDVNQPDMDVSGDYQAYLQGSLAKFIKSF